MPAYLEAKDLLLSTQAQLIAGMSHIRRDYIDIIISHKSTKSRSWAV